MLSSKKTTENVDWSNAARTFNLQV